MGCSALVFAENLCVTENIYPIDSYGNGTRVHIKWSKISRPHYKLRVGATLANLGNRNLKVDCDR